MAIEFGVLSGYAALGARAARGAASPRFAQIQRRVGGSLLIGAGAGLAAQSES